MGIISPNFLSVVTDVVMFDYDWASPETIVQNLKGDICVYLPKTLVEHYKIIFIIILHPF